MRLFAVLFLITFSSAAVYAGSASAPSAPASPAVSGVVADVTGAIVPGAQVDLVDATGTVAASFHSDGEGNFRIVAPHAGAWTLVVSEAGFDTVRTPVTLAAPAAPVAAAMTAPLHIVLPIAALSSTVQVNAENSDDLTVSEENRDSSVMTRRTSSRCPSSTTTTPPP